MIKKLITTLFSLIYFVYSSDPTLGIWTSPPKSVPSSKCVDGPLLGNGDVGVVVGAMNKTSDELTFFIGKNDFWNFGNGPSGGKKIIGLGAITFSFTNNNKNYQLQQLCDEGIVTFNISSSITGNATVSQKSNILIISFDNFGSDNIKYSLYCIPTSSSANTTLNGNNWCRRDSTSKLLFASAAIALNITLDKNTFILSVVSNFDINSNSTDKIVSTATSMASSLANDQNAIDQIWTDNAKWFDRFWNQSSISIANEPLIMQYWYKSLYIQGIANRENKFAPGLWGPFVTVDNPSWNGDYTLNYNFEAPYYGVYSANHINISLPYYHTILQYTKQAQINAEGYNCSNSLHYPGHIAPFGFTNSGDMKQHSDASFAALNFINYFRYTYDTDFITKNNGEVYNFLIGIANWWICWLDRYKDTTNDVYNDLYDCTRENCMGQNPANNTNPAISLSFITFILTNLVEIINITKINNPLVGKYNDILSHLASVPIGEFDKTTVLLPQQSPYYFKPGDNPLQLYEIWPGEQIGIGISNKTLLQIGINTVDKMNSWQQGNAYCEMYPSAVRVGYNISNTLSEWNNLLKSHMPQNGYVSMGGGGMDASGAIIAVNELVLQTWNQGVMRFFPVYNFGNASFTTLRSVGAFLVSAQMVNSKVISPIDVYSEQGNICKFESPQGWNINNIKVCQVRGTDCTTQIPLTCNQTNSICSFQTDKMALYQIYTT